MIVHSYYEEDPRVRREAEALVARGRPVDVIALRLPGDPANGILNGVRIRRLGVQRHQGAGLWVYLREYLSFLVRAGWAATTAYRSRRYRVIQVHSLPDFLVFAALPVKLAGAKVDPRSPRGDAGVLPDPVPDRPQPRSSIGRCCSRSGCRSRSPTGSSRSTS